MRKQYILGAGGRPGWQQQRGPGRKGSQVGVERAAGPCTVWTECGLYFEGSGEPPDESRQGYLASAQNTSPPSECFPYCILIACHRSCAPAMLSVPPRQSPWLQISIPKADPARSSCMFIGRVEECGVGVGILVEVSAWGPCVDREGGWVVSESLGSMAHRCPRAAGCWPPSPGARRHTRRRPSSGQGAQRWT